MLSVSLGEFEALRHQYADLDFAADLTEYNVIEIRQDQLSAKTLQAAIDTAAKTAQNDLIVVRNNGNTIVNLGKDSLKINVNSTRYGNVTLVSLGPGTLQLQSSADTGVIRVTSGNMALGGVVLCGLENAQSEAVSVFNLIQTGAGAGIQTSHVVKVSENSNRPGNFTLFVDAAASSDPRLGRAGTPIGTKSYEITFGVGGTLEAYLTGLSEAEMNVIVAGSMDFLTLLIPYDAEKTGIGDSDLCWASTAANMLAYTDWGNVNGFQTEDDIFAYFRNNFDDEQSHPYYANEWFITGDYIPSEENWANWAQPTNPDAGGFYPYCDYNNSIAQYVDIDNSGSITTALDYLKLGSAVGLALGWYDASHVRDGGHAITMWGAIYDTALSAADNAYFVSLLISDSDDNYGGGVDAPNVLQSLSIEWVADCNHYRFDTYSNGTGHLEGFTWLAAAPRLDTPTGVTAAAEDATTLTISWNPVENAYGYIIEYATNENFINSVSSFAFSSATDITYLMPNTTYYVRVCAFNFDGAHISSEYSDVVSVTTLRPAPAGFRYTEKTMNSITLEWNATDGVDSYILEFSSDGANWTQIGGEIKDTYYTHGLLNADTAYYYRVYSVNTEGTSAPNVLTVRTLPLPPAIPANFRSTAQTMRDITLSWNSVTGAASYKLEYSLDGISGWTQIGGEITDTYYTHGSLNADTEYYYRVSAVNAGGTSAPTSVLIAKTLPLPPIAPAGLRSTGTTAHSVTLEWDSVSIATGYQIRYQQFDEYRQSDEAEWTQSVTITISGTSATINGLCANTSYEFQVRARNAGGISAWSLPVCKKTDHISYAVTRGFPAVTGFRVASKAAQLNSVTVEWKPSSGSFNKHFNDQNGTTNRFKIEVFDSAVKKNGAALATFDIGGINRFTSSDSGYIATVTGFGTSKMSVTITGLEASTKYKITAQACFFCSETGSETGSKIVKISASTKKYPVLKGLKVDPFQRLSQSIGLVWNNTESVADHTGITDGFKIELLNSNKVSLAVLMINGNNTFTDISTDGSYYRAAVTGFGTPYMTIKFGGLAAKTKYTFEITAVSSVYGTQLPKPVKISASTTIPIAIEIG